MYTLTEIAALRKKCIDLELEGREILEKYSDEELQAVCNGIGPRGIGAFLRTMLNMLHPSLQYAAFIHDAAFEESDGTEEAFSRANAEFLANSIKTAKAQYAWYDWRRYWLLWQSCRLAAYCRRFGKMYWHLAAMNRGKRNGTS